MNAILVTPVTLAACRRNFENEHKKFLTKSMLLLEDLDKEFAYGEDKYTIDGMWINEDSAIDIIIHDEFKNYYKASHREVSRMMGFFRYRNPTTGVEYAEDYSKRNLVKLEETKETD